MNLSHLSRLHEEATKTFECFPGDDIEFEVYCRLCGMVSEAMMTVPDPRMGSLKLLYRCPQCLYSGTLILAPIPAGGY